MIVHDQGSSRQTSNSRSAPVLGRSNGQIRRPHHYPKDCQPPRPEIRFPAPIKAKTPAIVPNQASSRQTMKFNHAITPSALPSGTASFFIGRAGAAAPPHLNKIASIGTESTDHGQVSLSRQPPIKAKNPVIVHDQGSSSQTPNFRSAPVLGRSNGQTRRPLRSVCRPARCRPYLRSWAFICGSPPPFACFAYFAVIAPPISETRNPRPGNLARFPRRSMSPFPPMREVHA